MRRAAVVAYDTIRAERITATAAWKKAERAALRRDAFTAAYAKARGELN